MWWTAKREDVTETPGCKERLPISGATRRASTPQDARGHEKAHRGWTRWKVGAVFLKYRSTCGGLKPLAYTWGRLEHLALGELIKTRKTNTSCSHSYMEARIQTSNYSRAGKYGRVRMIKMDPYTSQNPNNVYSMCRLIKNKSTVLKKHSMTSGPEKRRSRQPGAGQRKRKCRSLLTEEDPGASCYL